MDLNTVSTWLTLFAGIAIGWFLKLLEAYATEKGKNLATKEDITEITNKIESVKSTISSRLHVHQFRYDQEFKILLELTEKLVAARDGAQLLRPEQSYGDINEEGERKLRTERYMKAARELYQFVETRQPFFPPMIYQAVSILNDVSWKEFVQFKHYDPKTDGVKFWEDALKNSEAIKKITDACLLLIRHRIEQWEAFDPERFGSPAGK